MKYEIKFQNPPGFFHIETKGAFCVATFRQLAEDLLAHREWKAGTHCLFNYLNTDFSKVSLEKFREISWLHYSQDNSIGSGKSAFVVKDDLNFGLGRMYQGMTEAHVSANFGTFRNLDDALAWIFP